MKTLFDVRERVEKALEPKPQGADQTSPEECVEFVFHTYHGFLAFFVQTEHRFRLTPDRARELLWRFHKFNLSWGLLAYGGPLIIPLMSYGNYLAQKRRIAKQERALPDANACEGEAP